MVMKVAGRPRYRMALGAGLLVLTVAGAANAAQPSLYHRVLMRGQVVEQIADRTLICIGNEGAAQVGDELTILRHKRVPLNSRGGKRRARQVATARVAELSDSHYARVEIIQGAARVGDRIRL